MDFRAKEIDFREADRRYAELKRQFEAGTIGVDEFNAQHQQLMVQDNEGHWWAKSPDNDEWHYFDGSTWVRGTPPGYQDGVRKPPSLPLQTTSAPHPEGAENEENLKKATPPSTHIEVDQKVGRVDGGDVVGVDIGEVLGDVSISSEQRDQSYTLRVGTLNGNLVSLAPPQERLPQARPIPVFLRPRRSSEPIGRKEEINAASTTLQVTSPAEFHGPAGVGKTKLLHHLAYYHFAPAFSGGVVSFTGISHKPLEDLLLDLFDAFYERESTYKPTSTQVRHFLKDEEALIILDDVELEREDVEAMMDAVPSCTFLLGSTERRLWGDGRALALRGLPPEDALALVEHELGRSLAEEERPATEALCTALGGSPLRLQQLVALVQEDGYTFAELAGRFVFSASPAEALTEQALAACTEQERSVLAALAVARGANLGERHISALTGIADVAPVLDSLQRRKLAQSHSPRYNLTGSLDEALPEEWDLASWNEWALEHLTAWAEQQRHAPEHVAEEADAILGVLRWALQEQRWEEALRLGRAVEGSLALSGQWGAWAQVLGWELQASRALDDRSAEAWSLHQSGSRALCLEDTSTARAYLTQALELRESLGDSAGAAVTRHNLELLGPGGPDGDHEPEGDGGGDGGGWVRPWLWPGIILLAATLLLLSVGQAVTEASNDEPVTNAIRDSRIPLHPILGLPLLPIFGSTQPTLGEILTPGEIPGGGPGGGDGSGGQTGSASLGVSPSSLEFEDQEVGTTSERQSITLSNTGDESLTIIDVTTTAPDASDFNAEHQCSSVSLGSGESCTIRVGFTPSDLGSRSANLGIDHNVTGSLQAAVSLSGNGIDTTPPTLKLPGNITVEAEDANGARVDYDATATDEIDGEVAVDCSTPSRSIFKLGETPVTCTATDKSGNEASGSFLVKVQDTTPPELKVPDDITIEVADESEFLVPAYSASADDKVDGAVPATCRPAVRDLVSGMQTEVTCSATDTARNTSRDSFNVTFVVIETIPYYEDTDGDGLGAGDPQQFEQGEQPSGWVEQSGDECPNQPGSPEDEGCPIIEKVPYYEDADGDGLGAGNPQQFEQGEQPSGWVEQSGDVCPTQKASPPYDKDYPGCPPFIGPR